MLSSHSITGGAGSLSENIIDEIQGGVIICQIEPAKHTSKTIYISEGWTQLTGYTLEALEQQFGGDPTAVILAEDQAQTLLAYQEQLSQGRSYRAQYRIRHRDGHLIWCIDRGVATVLGDGVFQNQSIITDITPLMESEEKLRLSEARFRIAVKASNTTIFEYDVVNNVYVSVENAELIFRTSAEEAMGRVSAAKKRSKEFAFEDAQRVWYHADDVPYVVQARDMLFQNGIGECEIRVRQP